MRLLAAIVTEPTDDQVSKAAALKGLDKADYKIDQLKDLVTKAWTAMQTRRQALPDKDNFYQYVFLAPEYFFSNQRYVQDRFFTHDTKRRIISELAALAKKFPEILLVPGTVLWAKDAFKTPAPKIGTRGAAQSQPTVDTNRVNNVLKRIHGISQTKFHEASNEVGWSHHGTFDGIDAESSMDMPNWYLVNADTQKTRIAQNVAYVCLNGKVLKYAKVGNFKEVEGESGTIVFAPGNIEGKFTIGNVRYSIEICRDHYIGVIDQSTGGNNAHVRIIVSSYIDNQKASILQNPVVLHSSTEKHGEFFIDTYDNSFNRVSTDPLRIKQGSGCKLISLKEVTPTCHLYDIEMDNQKLGISKAPIDFTAHSIPPVQHIY